MFIVDMEEGLWGMGYELREERERESVRLEVWKG